MKVGDLVLFDMGGDGPPPAPKYTEVYKPRNPGVILKITPQLYHILWRNGDRTFEHESYLKEYK